MIYDRRVANISREEFEELLAIVRSPPPGPLTAEDRWRHAYQHEQRRKQVIGYQQDLFDAKAVTHFRRNAPAPEFDRPPVETVAAKLDRIRGDPLATFGPPRSDRPAILSRAAKAAIIRGAANWLRVGQRIRIVDAPGAVNPAFGPQRFLGRAGVIWRLCTGTFAERCYVFLDPVGGERTDKIEMVELRTCSRLNEARRRRRGGRRAAVRPIDRRTRMLTSRSQRWRQRRSTFVDDETVIDPRHYAVDVLPHHKARAFVAEHHYLGRYPAAQLAVGLFGPGAARRSELAGVIVFGVPASAGVITRHTGFDDPARGCVLQRLLCLPSVAGNGESFFASRAFRLLRREKPAIEAVVSFSDPQYGHCGTVYAALSGAYRGRTRPRTVLRIAGETISDRTLSKIRNLERGHGGAIDQLVRLGAPPPRPGQHPADWLAACTASGTLSPHRQSPLFAYCFELTRRARRTGRHLPRAAYPRFADVVEAELARGALVR